jgi:heptosyltransferase-2
MNAVDPRSTLLHPQRILVRGVNWLGDAVMSTPALQRLREAKPTSHISLLTHQKLASLWKDHPDVDSLLTFESGESVLRIARRLRSENFDVALLLPNSPRSALEVFFARIPQRIGYAQAWREFLLTHCVPSRPGRVRMRKRSRGEIRRLVREANPPARRALPGEAHHIHDYLHLAAVLGANPEPVAPRLVVKPDEVEAIRKRFEFPTDGIRPRLLFGLNAGAEYGPAKRWPRERFVAAAIALQRQTNCHWWIFGSDADRDLASDMAAEIQAAGLGASGAVRSLAGLTSLRDLCVALSACDVVLTNDTGPMHVAAAVGTPVVVPFGSTSPELTAPGLPRQTPPAHVFLNARVACAPCFRRRCPIDFRCMMNISVEQAVAGILRALQLRTGSIARE